MSAPAVPTPAAPAPAAQNRGKPPKQKQKQPAGKPGKQAAKPSIAGLRDYVFYAAAHYLVGVVVLLVVLHATRGMETSIVNPMFPYDASALRSLVVAMLFITGAGYVAAAFLEYTASARQTMSLVRTIRAAGKKAPASPLDAAGAFGDRPGVEWLVCFAPAAGLGGAAVFYAAGADSYTATLAGLALAASVVFAAASSAVMKPALAAGRVCLAASAVLFIASAVSLFVIYGRRREPEFGEDPALAVTREGWVYFAGVAFVLFVGAGLTSATLAPEKGLLRRSAALWFTLAEVAVAAAVAHGLLRRYSAA